MQSLKYHSQVLGITDYYYYKGKILLLLVDKLNHIE